MAPILESFFSGIADSMKQTPKTLQIGIKNKEHCFKPYYIFYLPYSIKLYYSLFANQAICTIPYAVLCIIPIRRLGSQS